MERSSSLFYVAFAKEASLIKDDLLDPIDTLLDNPDLVDLVRSALHQRHPRSRDLGRPSIAPDRLLRCCALKHIKGWSLRMLERELRNGLAYRKFTRFDEDPIPDFSVFSRTFALLGGELLDRIHRVVVAQARASGQSGRCLRLLQQALARSDHCQAYLLVGERNPATLSFLLPDSKALREYFCQIVWVGVFETHLF